MNNNGTAKLAGYSDAWKTLQRILHKQEFNALVAGLYDRIANQREYVYSRKGGVQIYFIPYNSPTAGELDLIVARFPNNYQPERPEWVLEKVIKRKDNKIRRYGSFEKALLQFIGPRTIESR